METMLLHLDKVDFKLTSNTKELSSSGEIYITLGTVYFPEKQWYDMVSVGLDTWLPRLISFAQNHTDSCALPFMDGPCCIKLERRVTGAVTAVCLWDHQEQISRTEIRLSAFLESAAACARKYAKAIYDADTHRQFGGEISKYGKLAKQLRELT